MSELRTLCKIPEILWKFCEKAQFPNRPKLCGNCAFPQNFPTRKLGEITVFYAVVTRVSYFLFFFFILLIILSFLTREFQIFKVPAVQFHEKNKKRIRFGKYKSINDIWYDWHRICCSSDLYCSKYWLRRMKINFKTANLMVLSLLMDCLTKPLIKERQFVG